MSYHYVARAEPFRRQGPNTFIERQTPDKRSEHFERMMRRLQPQRHQFAVEAHWLEKYVNKMDESAYQVGNMPYMIDYSDLPEKAQKRMHAILKWYEYTAAARKSQEQKLQEHFGSTDSRYLGDALFAHVQNMKAEAAQNESRAYPGRRRAIGSVYFTSHPLAFGMVFTNEEDYRAFTESERGVGVYFHHSVLSGDAGWAAGEYEAVPMIASMRITDKPIKARDIRRIARIDDTMPHELAHALHHQALGLFSDVEADWEPYLSPEDAAIQPTLRGIKDEVLAFVKDGSQNISAYLQSPSYKHFFDALNDLDRPRVVRYIQQITLLVGMLDNTLYQAPVLPRRQILYYQLLDIPLPLMPQTLQHMQEYYLDVMSAQAADLPAPDMSQIPEGAYFGPLQSMYTEAMRASQSYRQQQESLALHIPQWSLQKPARYSTMQRDRLAMRGAKNNLLFSTDHPFPAYATELKFLPEVGRTQLVVDNLNRVLGYMQSMDGSEIRTQFDLLMDGHNVVGETPSAPGFVTQLQRYAQACGFTLDQCELTEVDADRGVFTVGMRLVVPAAHGQEPCRVKMQMHFTARYPSSR